MPLFARHCLKKSESDLWILNSSRGDNKESATG